MAWRRSDAPRDGPAPDGTPDDGDRHPSRAPDYWDDVDDTGAPTVPGSDVLSTSIWESRGADPRPRPRRNDRNVVESEQLAAGHAAGLEQPEQPERPEQPSRPDGGHAAVPAA